MQGRSQVRDPGKRPGFNRVATNGSDISSGVRREGLSRSGRNTGLGSTSQSRKEDNQSKDGKGATSNGGQAASGWDKLFSFQFSA